MTLADRALTVPFFTWIAGIVLLMLPLGFDTFQAAAWVYAGKTCLCAGLLFFFRPWRFVSCQPTRGDWVLGVLIGLAVYILWALPESTPWQSVTDFYYRWCVMMPGTLPDYSLSEAYAWNWHLSPTLAVLKLIGSAFVIAPIEEFFFRGWLMRWLSQRDWRALPLAKVTRDAFWITAVVFAFEHDRFVGGLLAGVAYGALAVRTNSLRASIIAHSLTNLILGLQVLLFDAYRFW